MKIHINHLKYPPSINAIIELLENLIKDHGNNMTIRYSQAKNLHIRIHALSLDAFSEFDIEITQPNSQLYYKIYQKSHYIEGHRFETILYYEDPNFIDQFNAIIKKAISTWYAPRAMKAYGLRKREC